MPISNDDTSEVTPSNGRTGGWFRFRRNALSLVLIVAAMAGAGIAVASGRSAPSRSAASVASVVGVAGSVAVTIKDFAFDPVTVTVKAGSTVVWTNLDSEPHTVRTIASTTVKSSTLATDATFAFAFATPGVYAYHCSIHPEMHATIIVTK